METKNPYSDLLTIMQSQGTKFNPPFIRIGQVIQPLPDLLIKVDDLLLDLDNLLLSDELRNHTRSADLEVTSGTGETGQAGVGDHGSHSHLIEQIGFTQGELRIQSCLEEKDLVALLPLANQRTYIVLCKVVNLSE